jgi:alanyl-tRNA synthetase
MTPQTWNWQRVADQFLDFFRSRDHMIVPSSSLIPADDPTLLFTNAGMVQFKNVFLGHERRAYRRAVTLQKCMRVQGKHNDLDNVGPSPWHHTFFLMLGNFSFGDYFKREAVDYAWELMTKRYGIDARRLIITVHAADQEAATAWRAMGVPDARVLRMGDETNFWMMADVGPCGPTSELHYDWGPQHCTCRRPDCSVALDNGCLRWLEVWNLVFMQFDQQPGGARVPLPQPGVDTGMGLERITAVLQDVNDDYRTDLFTPLMDRLQRILGHTERQRQTHALAYRVMVDHGRAMTFLIADGVVPGNEGGSYVLRMIMRRAMRFGRTAGVTQPFLAELAGAVAEELGSVYPELHQQSAFIQTAARQEEERFAQTLTSGLQRLEALISDTADTKSYDATGHRMLPGDEVFRLYDTFGFPIEMTRDVARERGLSIDEEGFARAMQTQRARARAAQTFGVAGDERRFAALVRNGTSTEFVGYTKHIVRARILALLVAGERVTEAVGVPVDVVLDRTPFYAEGGGQVGDTGSLTTSTGAVEVGDTQRPVGGLIVHRGSVTNGTVRVGQSLRAAVDVPRRRDIMRNHTATHLLHQALRELLSEHARQSGSLVAPDRLRFDFVHLAALTAEQRNAVERRVNEQVLADLPVRASWMSYDQAIRSGAIALFGEKYGERVRVISIDGYSRELCGGTHLSHTSQIGLFKITAESSVAAGVRRIEAVTGHAAYTWFVRLDDTLRAASERLRIPPEELPDRITRLIEREKELERDLRAARARSQATSAAIPAVELDGTTFVFAEVDAGHADELRAEADRLRAQLDREHKAGVVVVGSTATGAVVVTRTTAAVPNIDAGQLVRALADEFGGSGGGRPTLGQGGIKEASKISELVRRGRDPVFLRMLADRLRDRR